MKPQSYAKGDCVFLEGEVGECAYLVQSGRLEVSREVDGKQSILGNIEAGKIFGEMALISDAPRMATVTALEDSVLIAVPPQVFEKQLTTMDAMTKALLLSMISHVRSLSAKVATLEKELGKEEPEVVFFRPKGFGQYEALDPEI